jgi:hypothetical protein
VPQDYLVDEDAAITFGAGRIWGVFLLPEEERLGEYDETVLLYYNCATNEWATDEDSVVELGAWVNHTAITYQPGSTPTSAGRVFITGNEDGEYPWLYCYDIDNDDLDDDEADIGEFGAGASLAHGPAWHPVNVPTYPNPGWLYGLRGGSNEFWRYAIPYELVAVDNLCPAEGAVISDRTPPFKWSPPPAFAHRLVVATDASFNDIVLDVQPQSPEYEPDAALANGEYYWKTGVGNGLGGWSWSEVHNFLLDAGWGRLEDLPVSVTEGAALAYDHQYYYLTDGLVAFPGGTGVSTYYHCARGLLGNTWTTSGMHTTPHPQVEGTGLATPTPDAERQPPWAVFGGDGSDYAYMHHRIFGWQRDELSLPGTLGAGASLTYARHDGKDWLYLILGGGSREFYRRQLTGDDELYGGGQSRSVLPMTAGARILGRGDELALEYRLDAAGPVRVTLCDVTGRVVATLHSGRRPAGAHELRWSPRAAGLRAGAYVVNLDAGGQQARLKVIVR